MSVEWQHQLRIYLPEEVAKIARTDAKAPALKRLADVLAAHRATLVNQLDAFEAYVAEAEREGLDKYPLYKWTKATLEDPAKRLKHIKAFAVRVEDREVYSEQRRIPSMLPCGLSSAATSLRLYPDTTLTRRTTSRSRPSTANEHRETADCPSI